MCHTTHDTTGRTITFHDHTGREGTINISNLIPAGVFERILNVIEVFEDTDHPDTIETLEGT